MWSELQNTNGHTHWSFPAIKTIAPVEMFTDSALLLHPSPRGPFQAAAA